MSARPGHDPTRRNRNAGTTKRGHGRDNRMGIPWPDDRDFVERLVDPVTVERKIAHETWGFVVEPTLHGHAHFCTIDDLVRVLGLLPADDLEGVRTVLLRQPTRKQERLNPVWGRWGLAQALGPHDRKWRSPRGVYRRVHWGGPLVMLEAQPRENVVHWGKRLGPDGARELESLRTDGHRIVQHRRGYDVHTTPETCRSTQLFRTLPHEIGHHVDYWRQVVRPSAERGEAAWAALHRRYWSRPSVEREAFADRYAADFVARMQRAGELPFERELDTGSLWREGLDPAWFAGPEPAEAGAASTRAASPTPPAPAAPVANEPEACAPSLLVRLWRRLRGARVEPR